MTHHQTLGFAALILGIVLLSALAPTLPRWPARVAALLLTLLCVAWLMKNSPMEGGVLRILSPGHGITDGDMVSVGGLAAAAYALLRSMRR